MAVAFGYSLGSSILAVFGLASFFPTGNINALYEGASLFSTLGTSVLVTLFYSTVLAYLTLKYFKKMEFYGIMPFLVIRKGICFALLFSIIGKKLKSCYNISKTKVKELDR